MGRGGPEHRYLQQLITQWGDGMGYRATIEKPILDGAGSVDVALERAGRSVACQVSVTTSAAWEADNVRKCLAAKFSPVVVVATDAKRLARLRKEIEPSLAEADRATVRYFTPEELFAHLQELDVAELKSEKLIRGYRVKKSHAAPPADDGAQRRQTVSRIVAEALKRRKPKK